MVCHSVPTILTKIRQCPSQMLVPRLKKQEMIVSFTEPEYVNIICYFDQKKPPMPYIPEVNLNNTFNHMQQVSRARVQMIDFQFFKDIATKIECLE